MNTETVTMKRLFNYWFFLGLTFGIVLSTFTANAQLSEPGIPESFRLTQKKAIIIPTYKLDSVRVSKMIKSDQEFNIDNRYGVVQTTDIDLKEAGVKTEIQGKGIVWQYKIESLDAYSLGIFFKTFHLPTKASVFIYDSSRTQLRGAFTQYNNNSGRQLPVAEFPGNNMVIEYFEPLSPEFSGELVLGSVSQAYTNFQTLAFDRIGINCESGKNWQDVKNCVCLMTYHDSQYSYYCTGALLNNVKEDETPYFLTANHCIRSELVANTLVTYFNYENSTCSTNDALKYQTIAGATFLAGSDHSDFSLLLLKEYPPDEYNPFYAGWDARDNNPYQGVCIHHPNGEPKCIAIDTATITSYPDRVKWSMDGNTTFSTTPGNTHWQVQFVEGYPEWGSSGAPLFDQNRRIVGQLHGGASFVLLFGKFSESWNHNSSYTEQLAHWLDPDNTTKTLNGNWKFPPIANFRAEIKEVCANVPVSFYDESLNKPTNWLWRIKPSTYSFTNGTDSTSQNPRIMFHNGGNYTVSLNTSNKYGDSEQTQQNYIIAKNKLDVKLQRINKNNEVCACDLKAFPLVAGGAVAYNFMIDKTAMIDTKVKSDTLFLTLNPAADYTKSFDTWIKVIGTSGQCSAFDSLLLHVIIQPNDNIANAIRLNMGRNTGYSNQCATVEKYEPYPFSTSCLAKNNWCPNPPGRHSVLNNSIWFTFLSPSNGWITINTNGFDDQIAVYEATSFDSISMAGNQYAILAANDNRSVNDNTALIENLALEPGKQYWLQVDGNDAAYGDLVIDLISSSLEVFPNPSKGKFNLIVSDPNAGIAYLSIFNLNGRKLYSEQFNINVNSNNFNIDLSGFSKGIYLLKIQINGTNLSKKLVVL